MPSSKESRPVFSSIATEEERRIQAAKEEFVEFYTAWTLFMKGIEDADDLSTRISVFQKERARLAEKYDIHATDLVFGYSEMQELESAIARKKLSR